MRKILLIVGILASLAIVQVVLAQTPEGVITYEVKVNLHRRLPPERAEMKSMIPEFRTTKEQLFFNAEESMYKPLIEDEEEQEFTSGAGGMRMVMRQPNTELYVKPGEQKIISKQEFMGKDYLIEDTLKLSPWKFGEETKVIQGYTCKQAYFTRTTEEQTMRITGSGPPTPEKRLVTQEITAWYTDQIRQFLGPERYNTLPGAVLAIDINNGERVIVAQKIELNRLTLMTDKILKAAAFENKGVDIQKESVDLKELVGQIVDSMKLVIEKNQAQVSFQSHGNNFSIDGSLTHLTNVIYNLLDNALKYSPNQPQLTITLKESINEVVLSVQDNGIGIPEEYKKKIFEKFFRIPTGDIHTIKGYGLGLSYVASVVHEHGGTIEVTSEPGKGSTFTIHLPRNT